MYKSNLNSRKQKIDPAFYKLVRIYIDFLEQLERNPMEGRLNFPLDFIEPIIQKSGWQGPYDSDLAHGKDFLTFSVKAGILKKNDIASFVKVISLIDSEDPKALLKTCHALINALPEEESRQFYRGSIKRCGNR